MSSLGGGSGVRTDVSADDRLRLEGRDEVVSRHTVSHEAKVLLSMSGPSRFDVVDMEVGDPTTHVPTRNLSSSQRLLPCVSDS